MPGWQITLIALGAALLAATAAVILEHGQEVSRPGPCDDTRLPGHMGRSSPPS
jgi:hypothetical protein